jgi:hypothetical protein
MTLREGELSRSLRARRSHAKQLRRAQRKPKRRPSALDAPLALQNDAQVLTFREWCQLNRISERTGRRILASGDGPVVTQLSEKRIGITIRSNREWQEARERA